MAKATYLEKDDIRHAVKKCVHSDTPESDAAAINFLFSTGVKGFEFAMIELRDLMNDAGNWRPKVTIRSESAFNDQPREIPIKRIPNLMASLDAMLDTQGAKKGARYRGQAPTRKLFLKGDKPLGWIDDYQCEKAATKAACKWITEIFSRTRCFGASLASGRRSFIINSHRAGVDTKELMVATGIKSKSDLLRQANSNPVALSEACSKLI